MHVECRLGKTSCGVMGTETAIDAVGDFDHNLG